MKYRLLWHAFRFISSHLCGYEKAREFFQIKENFCDIAGVDRNRILLVWGFISEMDATRRKELALLLTYL